MTDPVLRKLTLHGFRSLATETMEFGNPVFLVGQNGSGKSNFVDAFAFLSEAMTLPLQAVLGQRGGLAAVGHRSSMRRRPSDLGLAVTMGNVGGDVIEARYAFQLRALGIYGFKVIREQCFVRRSDGSHDWFDRVSSKKIPYNFRWKSTGDVPEPIMKLDALTLPLIGGDTRFHPVLRFLSDMRVYRIEPAALRGMQDPDGGIRLRSDGGNAASVLGEMRKNFPRDWKRLIEVLRSIVPEITDVRQKKHGNKLTLVFNQDRKNSDPVRFEAFSMSDGTLRVLGLLIAIFQRPPPSLLVIEEPEATMHPGALGPILDVLRHAGRFMQVVVTTHSPDVLDAEWIEDRHLRIVTWEEGETRVHPVSLATRTVLHEHLMSAGELLRSNALTPAEISDQDVNRFKLFIGPEDWV